MSSLVQAFTQQKALPISSNGDNNVDSPGLRSRLSSISMNLNPANIVSLPAAATWAVHGSKSLSSIGENAGSSIKKFLELGWAWVVSRKQDLEGSEDEKYVGVDII